MRVEERRLKTEAYLNFDNPSLFTELPFTKSGKGLSTLGLATRTPCGGPGVAVLCAVLGGSFAASLLSSTVFDKLNVSKSCVI